jgi:hypothetical protein
MHTALDTRSLSRIALAMACICLGAVAARAQEPSPSALAVARDVVITKGATGIAEPLVHGVIETVKNSFVPTNPNLTRELNEVATALHKEYDGKRTEVVDALASAYARHFTEQELKDLLLFYKTPLGQKFSKEEPAAIEDGFSRAKTWSDGFVDVVMARMRADMQKKGHSL